VSAQSVEEVKAAIEEFQSNIVAVELDLGRFHALRKDAREPTVAEVLEVRNFNQLLIRWIPPLLKNRQPNRQPKRQPSDQHVPGTSPSPLQDDEVVLHELSQLLQRRLAGDAEHPGARFYSD